MRLDPRSIAMLLAFVSLIAADAHAVQAPAVDSDDPWLRPYTGPTRADADATTLDGKVLCGYQGWFNTPGDGADLGFVHWGQRLDRPDGGRFTVDMWPDVAEYDPRDLCEIPGLKMPDGSPARLYSAFRKGPVLLHFRWMRQYGIDGVFLSRFIGETTNPRRARHVNTVLAHVREGCHREGRVWAMMLDLSMGRGAFDRDRQERLEVPLRPGEGPRGSRTSTIRGSPWSCYGGSDSGTAPGRRPRARSWSPSSRTTRSTAAST